MSFPVLHELCSSIIYIIVLKLFHTLNKEREKKLGLDVDLILMRL